MILEKLYIINITIIPYIDDDSREVIVNKYYYHTLHR